MTSISAEKRTKEQGIGLAALLLALVNSMFLWIVFFDLDFRQDYESYWWTAVLLLTWAVLLWRIWRAEIAPRLLNKPT